MTAQRSYSWYLSTLPTQLSHPRGTQLITWSIQGRSHSAFPSLMEAFSPQGVVYQHRYVSVLLMNSMLMELVKRVMPTKELIDSKLLPVFHVKICGLSPRTIQTRSNRWPLLKYARTPKQFIFPNSQLSQLRSNQSKRKQVHKRKKTPWKFKKTIRSRIQLW